MSISPVFPRRLSPYKRHVTIPFIGMFDLSPLSALRIGDSTSEKKMLSPVKYNVCNLVRCSNSKAYSLALRHLALAVAFLFDSISQDRAGMRLRMRSL